MKIKNEIGNRYGKLIVLEKADKTDSSKNVYWVCKCDCGNITIAQGTKLRNGQRVSCGCQRKEKLSQIAKSNILDEVNNVYSKLKVISLHHIDEKGNRYWNCLCECGNTTIVRGSELRHGHTKSCGCLVSQGEYNIIQYLTANNIRFETQKTFNNCRFKDTNALAKFDFYLPDFNICIEYDGIQHFKIGGWNTQEKLKKTREHDNFKTLFCQENNIFLLRIKYNEDIFKKLSEILK